MHKNIHIMDEVIEKIISQAEQEAARLPFEEQAYVYQETANRLVSLSSEVLMQAYPMEED